MARLTASARKALSRSEFAVPSRRAYPIEDRSHARNALSRVAANGTPAERKQVLAAVRKRYPGIGRPKGRGR